MPIGYRAKRLFPHVQIDSVKSAIGKEDRERTCGGRDKMAGAKVGFAGACAAAKSKLPRDKWKEFHGNRAK